MNRFHIAAGEYLERTKKQEVLRTQAIVNFLRENPLSTSDQIFQATGFGPMNAKKWIYSLVYKGQRVWRVNHRKMLKEGLI